MFYKRLSYKNTFEGVDNYSELFFFSPKSSSKILDIQKIGVIMEKLYQFLVDVYHVLTLQYAQNLGIIV